MRGTVAGALVMVVMGALPAAAQGLWDHEDEVVRLPVPNAAAVAPSVAMHRCLALPWGGVKLEGGPCTVIAWRELRPVRGERFFTATYRRLDITPATARLPADTAHLGEEVLFSLRPGAAGVTPVLHWFYFRSMFRSVDMETVESNGRLLLHVEPCWNGTGGCTNASAMRSGGRWVSLSDDWFRSLPDSVTSRLASDTQVDLATMEGRFPLFPRGYPQRTAPFQELRARLALEGTHLVLRSYRVVSRPR